MSFNLLYNTNKSASYFLVKTNFYNDFGTTFRGLFIPLNYTDREQITLINYLYYLTRAINELTVSRSVLVWKLLHIMLYTQFFL